MLLFIEIRHYHEKNGVLTYKNWIESWVHFNQSIEKGKTKGKNPGNLDILDIHDVFIPINYFPEASFKTICHLIDEQNFNPEFMIKLMIRNLHKINDDKTAFLFNYIDQHINSIKKGTLCEIFLDLYFNHHIEIANSFIKKYEKKRSLRIIFLNSFTPKG